MNADLIDEIKKTNKLLVIMATKDLPQTDKIALLSRVGFGQKEIADLVGTTSNTVGVTLNKLKKKKQK
ncbi:MAG: hypothetical protein H6580_05535 [Flammeovirgaceae bacterium]|nr:hypothetical protein [Flammeovirgaceae bacterium]